MVGELGQRYGGLRREGACNSVIIGADLARVAGSWTGICQRSVSVVGKEGDWVRRSKRKRVCRSTRMYGASGSAGTAVYEMVKRMEVRM
jgi:hypothetical protein